MRMWCKRSPTRWFALAGFLLAGAIVLAACARATPTPAPAPAAPAAPVAPGEPEAPKPVAVAPTPVAPVKKVAPVIGVEIDTAHPLADNLGPLKVDMPRFFTFSGTSSPGSSYTFFANPFIQMVESAFPRVTIRHLPGGTRANVERVGRGEAEIGISVGAEVGMATLPYKAAYTEIVPVRSMAILPFWNGNIGITLAGSGFETIADWSKPGFRLGALYAGSATYRFAFPAILGAHDNSYEKIKARGGSVYVATGDWKADLFDKLFGGQVDAIQWHGPIPDAFLKSQELVRDIVCISITDEEMKFSLSVYPGTAPNTIAAGTYKCNKDKDLQAFGYVMVFIASPDLPNEVVYNLMWAVYRDDGKTIQETHPQNKGWDYIKFSARPEQQTSPWHPGAKMYWEARGLTIPPQLPPPAPWVQ